MIAGNKFRKNVHHIKETVARRSHSSQLRRRGDEYDNGYDDCSIGRSRTRCRYGEEFNKDSRRPFVGSRSTSSLI